MFETVLEAVCACLEAAELPVCRAWGGAAQPEGKAITVGLASGKLLSPGCGDYLGRSVDAETGAETERFGARMELELCLDCYAPENGAAALELLQRAALALEQLSAGLRLRELRCGEAAYDAETFCYHCRGSLTGTAFLVAETTGEEPAFRDFILRGVIKHERDN